MAGLRAKLGYMQPPSICQVDVISVGPYCPLLRQSECFNQFPVKFDTTNYHGACMDLPL